MNSIQTATETTLRRPGRLPGWVLWIGMTMLALSFVSGVAIWWGQFVNARFDSTDGSVPFATGGWVRLHGALNPFLCGLLGYLTHQHIRVGWRMRANLVSGGAMVVSFAGLAVSGAFLVYGGGEWTREWAVWLHRVLGLALPLALAAHWIQAVRWAKNL